MAGFVVIVASGLLGILHDKDLEMEYEADLHEGGGLFANLPTVWCRNSILIHPRHSMP